MWSEHKLFFQQFLENYHSTGAIAPSGRWLAKALCRQVAEQPSGGRPRQILEVGPGTGAVTRWLVQALPPTDALTLVELNDRFVDHLQRRFASEPPFQAVAGRWQLLHKPVEDLPADAKYDVIVSGLPLNNFAVADVERILATFDRLLAPGGVLSFFEYIAVRRARAMISGPTERQRLTGIGQALDRLFDGRRLRREWIWTNLPPAWVHHVAARQDEKREPQPSSRAQAEGMNADERR